MGSVNSVCISGNIGRDPELKSTPSGVNFVNFPVCVNERRKNPQSGEWYDEPNWVDVVFFGNRASAIADNLKKGSLVFVQGHLHQSKWQTKDGQNRSKLEVTGDEIHFGYKPQGQQPSQTQPQPQFQAQQQQAPNYAQQQQAPVQNGFVASQQQMTMGQQQQQGVYDEDIPF